ncbi:MAG: GAF domain-containing protein [Anaerolineales bacterium]
MLTQLLEPLPDLVLSLDSKGRIQFLNQAARHLPWDPSGAVPDILKAAQRAIRESGAGAELEIDLPSLRGEQLPFLFRVWPVQDAGLGGDVLLLVGADLPPARQLEELRILNEVARAGAEADDEDELIERITHRIGESLYSDHFGVMLVDENGENLRAHPSYHGSASSSMQEPLPLGHGITGAVASTGRAWRVGDVRKEPAYLEVDSRMRSELAVPIRIGERVIGVINAESIRPNGFNAADERLLATVAGQLAIGIERIRLLEAERAQRRLAESLRLAGVAISATLDFDTVLDRLLEHIGAVVPYDTGNVMLVEGDRARVARSRGYETYGPDVARDIRELNFDLDQTANLRRMAESGQPLFVPDTDADPAWVHFEAAAHIKSWVGAPIQWHGRLIGFFSMDKAERGFYRREHAERLSAFAGQAALALENARLFDESQRQMRELAGLYHSALATASELETGVLLQRLYEQVRQLIPVDTFSVALYLPETDELDVILAIEDDQILADPLPSTRVPMEEGGLTGWVMRRRQALLVHDLERDPVPAVPRHGDRPARSWLGVPLIVRDRLAGAISVQAFRPHAFGEADRRFLEALAGQVASAIENSRLFEATRRQAEELRVLVEISSDLRAAATVDAMMPILLQKSAQAVGASAGSVTVIDPETGRPEMGRIYPDASPPDILTSDVPAAWEGVLPGAESGPRIRSRISVPLRSQAGTIGVMHLGTPQLRAFSPSEVRLLTAIAEIAGNALHRARVLETLETRVSERTHELAEANDRLKELDRLKSDFLSNVSHELRTPITNILLYLELITQPDKEAERPRYTEILRREADRLARLIEDLLTLTRIEQDRAPINFQPVFMQPLVVEVLAAHEARARGRSVEFVEAMPAGLPPVLGDREQMVQIFANLIGNAVAYTPSGQRVVVGGRAGEGEVRGYVQLFVRNTGAAIPTEDLPHVFERFYRGRNGRDSGSPGTGLGLAICQEIVGRHKGWIELQSDEANGTMFTLWLPRADTTG